MTVDYYVLTLLVYFSASTTVDYYAITTLRAILNLIVVRHK